MFKRKHTYVEDEQTRKVQTAGIETVKAQRNRAYAFSALVLLAITGLSGAVVVLSRMQTVVPVISTIDSSTGHVVKVQVLTPDSLTHMEAQEHTELHDYVRNRNIIDFSDRQRLSDLVRLHSCTDAAKEYDYETSADNPNNPYYQVGQGGKRTVDVTGISLLNKTTGQVTFTTTTSKAGVDPKVDFFTAIIGFRFTGNPLAIKDRWENPHGFCVTSYRRDQELSSRPK